MTKREMLEDAQEKAHLMEEFISKLVRGGDIYIDEKPEREETCGILAEIAADYSQKIADILHSKDSDDLDYLDEDVPEPEEGCADAD